MSALKRLPGWRRRFEAAIDEIKARPFAWGEHDCGPGLAGRLALAMTGVDCAAQYRGAYDSASGALRVMRDAGFDNLADLVASVLPEVHISAASIGDIAAVPDDTPFGYALGVVNGERIFVLKTDGVGTVDLLDATRAFKVG
ncbi:DUF6950 family protein [Sinorhizobium medicae]|uniref:DUF6950 family protein n=1 Tax=Sinorhizobium medicae TaxID=110321 RepID=UPI0003F63415|nr:hypothetical protein [Sinorhizobium medicae]